MIGIGGLAHGVGYPLGATMASTLLIWAAPAQVILFGLLAIGANLPVIALAICISSIRFLPMCISLLPMLRRPEMRITSLLMASHYVAVTNWVEGMRRLPPLPSLVRLPYFFGFGNITLLGALAGTWLGYALVGGLSRPFAAALLFISPIYFTAAMGRAARMRSDVLAIVLGLGLTPLFVQFLPKGLDLIAIGLVGGTISYCAGRVARRKALLAKGLEQGRFDA